MKEISPWRIRRLAEAEKIEPEYFYTSDSEEVRLGDYWNILVKRRRVIILLFLLTLGVGAYFTLSATKLYTASATLKIEPENPQVTGVGVVQPVEGMAARWGGAYDYYQTQFSLLKSQPLAARVVTDLGLESNTAFTNSRIISPNPLEHVKSWMFRMLGYFSSYLAPLFQSEARTPEAGINESVTKLGKDQNGLSVAPHLISRYLNYLNIQHVTKTRLVNVQFTTPHPALSQALANAHVQSFMRMSLESRFNLTKEAREFLDQKITELKQKMKRSDAALNNFRRAHGVVSVEKGENIVVDRLVDLNKALTAARAQRIEAESLYRTVENKNYQDLAEIMKQGLVQQLKSNVANLEAERARLSTIFKPEHPRIQEFGQQISQARRALNNEIANVVGGINSGYAAALAKERALEVEANVQQQNALQLKELGVQYTILQEEVNANKSLYENVLKRLSETVVSNDIAISNMEAVEYAEKPQHPSGPNVPGYLLAYVLVGAMFSVGIAFLCEFFDSTISTPEEVWRTVGLSTLGVVPDLKFLNRRLYSQGKLGNGNSQLENSRGWTPVGPTAKELIISQPSISVASESYRAIRTAFLLSQAEKPPQVVVLTSPAPGEGKTITTLNLAIALAHDGHTVLVIDGDLRRGCCHARLGLQNNKGLANILTGQLTLKDGVRETSINGLSLLSRGILPPNPTELLGSRKMREILEALRQDYKFVLIDSPPVVALSDSAVLSVLSDGVLLVLDGQKTSSALTRKAVERLEMVRARMLGVILNGVNLDDPAYSYYRTYSTYYKSIDEEHGFDEKARLDPDNEFANNFKEAGHFIHDGVQDDHWEIKEETKDKEAAETSLRNEASYRASPVRRGAQAVKGDAEAPIPADDLIERKGSRSEMVEEAVPLQEKPANFEEFLAPQFVDRIIQTLSEAVGPIAPLLVLDRIVVLGESKDAFPKKRLRTLLDAISDVIPNEKLKSRFKKRLLEEIQGLDKL